MYASRTILCCLMLLAAPVTGAPAPGHAQAVGDRPTPVDATGSSVEQGQSDDTLFERVDTENAGFVVEIDLSLLTSAFRPGSTLRVVTGGTAHGDRVVWFDVGVGYAGGPVLPNPTSGFAVRADMAMNLPV